MTAGVSSQSNASTEDEWRTRLQEIKEIMRRLGSKEKSTTDSVDSSYQVADSRKESEDRTLLIKIHLQRYLISWEELECVFGRFGMIEYIEIFCPGEEFHSKIRFRSRESAIEALECINRRDVYDGCCQLELFLEASLMEDNLRRNESRLQKVWDERRQRVKQEIAEPSRGSEEELESSESEEELESSESEEELESSEASKPTEGSSYEAPQDSEDDAYQKMMASAEQLIATLQKTIGAISVESNSNSEERSPTEDLIAEKITCSGKELSQETQPFQGTVDEFQDCREEDDVLVANANQTKTASVDTNQDTELYKFPRTDDLTKPENDVDIEEVLTQHTNLKVNLDPSEFIVGESAISELSDLVNLLIELWEIRLANFRMDSIDSVSNINARKVFAKMTGKKICVV